jgi:hypothetical protein
MRLDENKEQVRTSLIIEVAGFVPVFMELGVNGFFCYFVIHKIIMIQTLYGHARVIRQCYSRLYAMGL